MKNASHDDIRHLLKVNETVVAALAMPVPWGDLDAMHIYAARVGSALAFLQGYTESAIDWGQQEQEPWDTECSECHKVFDEENEPEINGMCIDCYANYMNNRTDHGCMCTCDFCVS